MPPGKSTVIAVLGAGSWGLTLASLWGGKPDCLVKVYCRNQERAKSLASSRQIDRPRTEPLPESVQVLSELSACLEGADVNVLVCSSQGMRALTEAMAETGLALPVLVSAVKGLELKSHLRMSEIIQAAFPQAAVAALSGPNLAMEVLSGLPTASVVACKDIAVAKQLRQVLSAPRFRVYANDDLPGVELGGTLKNVIAIAAGVCDGLGLGVNAKASLLTRGLAEMTRLAVRLGARPSTMAGLSGMGDLFATCESSLSRNYRVGYGLARGKSLETILTELGQVAEGVTTTQAVCELSIRLGLELPIAEQVESTLKGISTPEEAIMALLSRPLSSE